MTRCRNLRESNRSAVDKKAGFFSCHRCRSSQTQASNLAQSTTVPTNKARSGAGSRGTASRSSREGSHRVQLKRVRPAPSSDLPGSSGIFWICPGSFGAFGSMFLRGLYQRGAGRADGATGRASGGGERRRSTTRGAERAARTISVSGGEVGRAGAGRGGRRYAAQDQAGRQSHLVGGATREGVGLTAGVGLTVGQLG